MANPLTRFPSSPAAANYRTAAVALTGSAIDIIPATSRPLELRAILCANKTSVVHPVTILYKKAGTSYELAYQVQVPGNATFNALDGARFNLEQGDSITGNSDTTSQIVVTIPYVELPL